MILGQTTKINYLQVKATEKNSYTCLCKTSITFFTQVKDNKVKKRCIGIRFNVLSRETSNSKK